MSMKMWRESDEPISMIWRMYSPFSFLVSCTSLPILITQLPFGCTGSIDVQISEANFSFYRGFVGARFAHTVSYLFGLQPWRAMAFFVNIGINIFMAYRIIITNFW